MARLLRSLRQFYSRRIAIPVTAQSLVLDIGSGDKPHWRADVLLDSMPNPALGGQREGGDKVIADRPFVVADITKMPFRDHSFDYVICSHVLEHVLDPEAAIHEIERIGKKGYIELPFEGAAKVQDFITHRWYCRKDGETLVFTGKNNIAFDEAIDTFVTNPEIQAGIRAMGRDYFDAFSISLYWNGSIRRSVYGKPFMFESFDVVASQHVVRQSARHWIRTVVYQLLRRILRWWYGVGAIRVDIASLLQCPSCKNSVSRDIDEEYRCTQCRSKIDIRIPGMI